MARVCSSIPVTQQTVLAERIVVGACLALNHWHRGDAQWDLAQQSWFEDALGAHERYALSFVGEPLLQHFPREDTLIRSKPPLLFQEPERSDANVGVSVVHTIAGLNVGRAGTRHTSVRQASRSKNGLVVPAQQIAVWL